MQSIDSFAMPTSWEGSLLSAPKMLIITWYHVSVATSLAIVAVFIGTSVASLIATRKEMK